MLLGSAQTAVGYGANTLMIFTGAPQNTRRKDIKEMNIPAGKKYLNDHGIHHIMGHAPYVVNLGNTKDYDKYQFAIEFMQSELKRCDALGIEALSFHPGSHVGLGAEQAIKSVAAGLEQILTIHPQVSIAIETMAGKGTEIGVTLEQIAQIIELVAHNDNLSVTLDTCHMNDAGYNVREDFDGILNQFDKIIGLKRLKMIHLNDSQNTQGSHKDRHTNIGFGTIGFDALNYICHHPQLQDIPKIMETPYVAPLNQTKRTIAPYAEEIKMLKRQQFNSKMIKELQLQVSK